MNTTNPSAILASVLLLGLAACGGSGGAADGAASGRPPAAPGGAAGDRSTAVPVRVEAIGRRTISQYLQTNGSLEAENEVDLVARTSGPVVELFAEEGRLVRAGQLLARIDEREPKNQAAIARVARDEAQLAFDRAKTSWDEGLVSREAYDGALSRLASTSAQLESAEIQLAYTEIRAPFDALVVTRNIRQAQFVTPGTTLFRVSDFTPLLCRVEIPEKDLPRVRVGQPAHLVVEAFPGERFPASVARLRPTVDPATGTFTATLEVEGQGRLRPGMFASVYLETETRRDAVVIPRDALVLDSLGDTVYVAADGLAARREVRLGLRDSDSVEVVEGLAEGDLLIVLGQEGLADGTPVKVLEEAPSAAAAAAAGAPPAGAGPPPDALEAMRQRMKERGLSDQEIEQRLAERRQGAGPEAEPGAVPGAAGAAGTGMPPFMVERIKNATPEELVRIKARMKEFGMSDERIESTVKQIRDGDGGSS
ncbi:MAG: efflux RND transporter periplasmic adaptor subunit [Thermoanaerobaculales bacterium]|nr:efflux RND transporter periplasmic adaptor subunit [Thermoanaerobaculales bacterium]